MKNSREGKCPNQHFRSNLAHSPVKSRIQEERGKTHEGLLSERSRPQWAQGVFSLYRDPVSPSALGDSNLKSLLESQRIWKTVICVFVSQGKFYKNYNYLGSIVRAGKG